jgi:hypothetical protein
VPIGGKPMVRWPVEPCSPRTAFLQVRVLAQEPERIGAALPSHPKLVVEQSAASIAATLETLCFDPSVRWPLFVTTADHVLLDAGMIDELCDLGEPADIAIGGRAGQSDGATAAVASHLDPVSRRRLQRRQHVPAQRPKVLPALELWRSVEQDARRPGRCCGRFGAAQLPCRGIALADDPPDSGPDRTPAWCKVEAVDLSDPLAAVDVDKLADHGLVETLLSERE